MVAANPVCFRGARARVPGLSTQLALLDVASTREPPRPVGGARTGRGAVVERSSANGVTTGRQDWPDTQAEENVPMSNRTPI
jgi:hypothetical protein